MERCGIGARRHRYGAGRVSHYATEPAAKKLEKTPELAARLWLAQALRIVNAKKSQYYDSALSNSERARARYLRAGAVAAWEKVVRNVCATHFRKTGSSADFRQWAVGAKLREQPAFLEQAKQGWGERHGS